ncbi:MAG TPA: TaqI-like C-terminal specificity domain-containing protein, partial [Bacteroidales bacterium]|nr:TaqI-like C-terminal specificity domain-containing protein [Bacteroidales bacterium]
FVSDKHQVILEKIAARSNFKLEEKEVAQGIVAAPDEYFIVNNISQFNDNEKQFIKLYYTSTNRYYIQKTNNYIIYLCKNNFDGLDINQYPNIKNHFEKNKTQLKKAKIKYGTPNKPYYYLHRERDENFFKRGPKIACQTRSYLQCFLYTEEEYYGSRAMNFIISDRINLKYLVSLLNSKIIFFWLKNKGKKLGEMLQIDKEPLLQIPLIKPEDENIIKYLAKLVDDIISASKSLENCQLPNQIDFYNNLIKSQENLIDEKFYELYGLSADDKKEIEKVWKNNVVCQK